MVRLCWFYRRFAQTALVYSYTTTSQLQHFELGGVRYGHSYFIFKCAEHKCFEMDCAIDFDESPYTIETERIRRAGSDIENKGNLKNETMRMIYNRTIESKHTSLAVKDDIYHSFNQAGII